MIVLKVPFSKGSLGKNIGSELAPQTIIDQSEEIFSTELGFAPKLAFGAIQVNQENIDETNKNIIEKVSEELASEKLCLLGGDHSITYAGFKAFARKNPGAGLLILDAHPDCEQGTDIPSHEDFVRLLVQQGIVAPDRLMHFGLRNFTGGEKQFLDMNKIQYFTMRQIKQTGYNSSIDSMTEIANSWPALYLSIDIDVADPSCAPGTGYLEPGGFTARQLINLIQRLKLLRNLKMCDIVEVNPKKDVNDMTSKLAARLMVELS
jgi:arginase family enzyme